MLILIIKGLLIGIAIAAPVGPIGILCIQRSLHHGFKIGMMSGLGAALGDSIYALIAGFGLSTVSAFIVSEQYWIRFAGSLFLMIFGIKLLIYPPHTLSSCSTEKSAWQACLTTFLLTLANPATILAFVAIFSSLGIGIVHTSYLETLIFVATIALGSAFWWFTLTSVVVWILKHHLTTNLLKIINWVSGSLIFIFGILSLLFINYQI